MNKITLIRKVNTPIAAGSQIKLKYRKGRINKAITKMNIGRGTSSSRRSTSKGMMTNPIITEAVIRKASNIVRLTQSSIANEAV